MGVLWKWASLEMWGLEWATIRDHVLLSDIDTLVIITALIKVTVLPKQSPCHPAEPQHDFKCGARLSWAFIEKHQSIMKFSAPTLDLNLYCNI